MDEISDYNVPMKIIEGISEKFGVPVVLTVDKEYNICLYIRSIDRIKQKKYFSNLEGRGLTYRDACIDFIKNALNTSYNLRFDKQFYATSTIRNMIKTMLKKYPYILNNDEGDEEECTKGT